MTPYETAQKACTEWFAYQNPLELEMALRTVEKIAPRVVMEIGTAHGATLASWAEVAKPDLVIALDPEDIPRTEEQKASFEKLAEQYKFERIPFYSRNSKAKDLLAVILEGRKVDFLFIDGAHEFQNVLFDFYAYLPYMAPNGVVGFHDIHYNETLTDAGSTVNFFWDRMKTRYEYDEFYCHSTMGIGFIYRNMPVKESIHPL